MGSLRVVNAYGIRHKAYGMQCGFTVREQGTYGYNVDSVSQSQGQPVRAAIPRSSRSSRRASLPLSTSPHLNHPRETRRATPRVMAAWLLSFCKTELPCRAAKKQRRCCHDKYIYRYTCIYKSRCVIIPIGIMRGNQPTLSVCTIRQMNELYNLRMCKQ